ncbi:MAG: hypothetical protein H6807_12680 [Planctomycetes bacterium]|nr:hypothetical protein [Planctomycetota bacterium]
MRVLLEVDDLLRSSRAHAIGRGLVPVPVLATVLCSAGFLYGLAMGSFNGQIQQMLYSGLKVPLLLLVATLVCLPSFFVLNSVLGLRDDFSAALRGVFAAQATLAVVLAATSPWPLLLYGSTTDYRLALNFNGLPFLLGALAAQIVLARHYRPLIARNRRQHLALWTWIFLYILVAMQSAWAMRPFVGDPSLEPQFFRDDAWSNGFVEIGRDLLRLGGLDRR